MPTTKRTSKRKSHKGTAPVLGAVGMSLSLAGGASAAVVPPVDLPSRQLPADHEVTFNEEELADVSLATFYIFDKENGATPQVQYARGRGCRGCGGCRGCRGCRGCGGCGGCGGCCPFWWCGACLPG